MATRAVLTFSLCVAALPAFGAEVAGVKLEDRTNELVLNGAGLRTKVIFNVYVIGLYLPAKKTDAAAVLQLAGPKRVAIHMLRNVGAAQFSEALVEGIRDNHSEAESKVLEPQVKELVATMAEIKQAKKGMTIALDWTGAATQLVIDGKPAGRPIAGEDFYRALLRIWLGETPVQEDLKRALLGQG
jgi:hypothetical protein